MPERQQHLAFLKFWRSGRSRVVRAGRTRRAQRALLFYDFSLHLEPIQ